MTELKESKPCINGCGKEIKNQGAHDRFCPVLVKKEPAGEVAKQAPEMPPFTQPPLIISDVQQYKQPDTYQASQLVAWYNTEEGLIYKEPAFIGLMDTERGDVIPCALICVADGTILPVFMVAGFVGMYPMNTVWPEPEHEAVMEEIQEQPPEPEPQPIKEPEPSPRKIIAPAQPAAKPKKPGLFNALFAKKPEPKTQKEVNETLDLINDAINATKA